MIQLGEKFPSFSLKSCIDSDSLEFPIITNDTYKNKWQLIFFWPKDFTFVCPTEIIEFGTLNPEFQKLDTQVLGCSIDSEFVHLSWKKDHPGLKNLPFPMLSDIKRELSNSLGILDQNEGVSQRATFIIDPNQIIRYIDVTDLNIGRNPNEALRVLKALQHGGLMPCSWKEGEKAIELK